MTNTATAPDQVVLARQPILNATKETAAFELLYRSANSQTANVLDARQATASVLVNALNTVGLSALVGKAKAFINCDRSMLLEDVFSSLDPKAFVLEVLEDVEGDDDVAKALAGFKAAGFEIALDDFIMSPEHLARVEKFVPFASYVKLDLMQNSKDQIRDAARHFKQRTSAKMLAEKVETKQDFLDCHRFGYTLFQGYFFSRPEIVTGRKLDTRSSSVMRLLQILEKDAEVEELERAFKTEPALTVNLLRYINSAAVGLRTQIESIHQAVSMVGYRKLQSWLTLLLFAQTPGSSSKSSCLFDHAGQRARFMENLAQRAGADKATAQTAFLTGMLSCMDALCNVSIESIVKEFELSPDLTAALLRHEGFLGNVLKIAKAMEAADFARVDEFRGGLDISLEDVQTSIADSWTWLAQNRQ